MARKAEMATKWLDQILSFAVREKKLFTYPRCTFLSPAKLSPDDLKFYVQHYMLLGDTKLIFRFTGATDPFFLKNEKKIILKYVQKV